MEMIVNPGVWVRYAQHVEKGSLFYFFIRIEVGFKARKNSFSHGCEKLCIVESWEKDDTGTGNQFSFMRRIIQEVGFHTEGENLRDTL